MRQLVTGLDICGPRNRSAETLPLIHHILEGLNLRQPKPLNVVEFRVLKFCAVEVVAVQLHLFQLSAVEGSPVQFGSAEFVAMQ